MKSITIKETKTVLVLNDCSGLHDINLDYIEDDNFIGRVLNIIKKNLSINVEYYYKNPIINVKRTLDTMIEIEGKRYYTCRRFIRQEFVTREKELFIPDFSDLEESFCEYIPMETWNSCDGCCKNCIFNKSNYKYLK